jgi:hypothetical protein
MSKLRNKGITFSIVMQDLFYAVSYIATVYAQNMVILISDVFTLSGKI